MALIQTVANTLICSACRVAIAPKQKADGGLAFPLQLVHTVPKTKCKRYASVAPIPVVVTPVLSREERRQARWTARIEMQETQRRAEREREEAEYQANLAAGLIPPEPTDAQIVAHRSKLAPGEEIDERCFYCASLNHWSKDCLTI
jgi:hypothetical protein